MTKRRSSEIFRGKLRNFFWEIDGSNPDYFF